MSMRERGQNLVAGAATLVAGSIDGVLSLLRGERENKQQYGFKEATAAQLEAKKAAEKNPEERGIATSILAACRMVYGERCDLEKAGADVLLPRLNSFLIAYNDWVDVAEKIDPKYKGHSMIEKWYNKYAAKLNDYFNPTGDEREDARRAEFKRYFDVAFKEVGAVEHELFEVKELPNDPRVAARVERTELRRIREGRELVNAIETLMNIRACMGSTFFASRNIDVAGPTDIAGLITKYDWLIDPNYPENQLSDDERKARMLFFVSMSAQAITDKVGYKKDLPFKIWKPMTYMTEVLHIDPARASKKMDEESVRYSQLAERYGMSPTLISTANLANGLYEGASNKVMEKKWYWPSLASNQLLNYAENHGHIRESAMSALAQEAPDLFTVK